MPVKLKNIMSCFDGMGCLQIVLNKTGIKYENYYSSEIDKPAMGVSQDNYPDTIQLGSIVDIRHALTWKQWIKDRFYNSIYISDKTKAKYKEYEKLKDVKFDLIAGGSPCQGFSFAGKQLNFSDPRSKLFFDFVKLLKFFNPKYFLLENVRMKKKYLRVISDHLGVFPVRINSNLVSAQNRDRYYWTNIRTRKSGLFGELWTDIPQPEDRKIFLKDILQDESEVGEKYYLKGRILDW